MTAGLSPAGAPRIPGMAGDSDVYQDGGRSSAVATPTGPAALTPQQKADNSRNSFMSFLNEGEDSLASYAQSAMSAAMPELNKALQGVQESTNARGFYNSGLTGAYSGDVANRFQQNIANAVGSQAMNLYGTRLQGYSNLFGTDMDWLSGELDRETGERNAQRQSSADLWSGLAGAAGTVLGGPLGGAVGSFLGHLF